jgi:hypothetical protein
MKTKETKDLALAEFPAMPKRRLARATVEGIELPAYPGGNPYKIEWARLDTPLKVMCWIHHLAGKPWMSPQILKDLIVITMRHSRWSWIAL